MRSKLRNELAFVKTAFRFANSWDVLRSHFLGRQLPPMKISKKIAIEHNSSDDAMFIIGEIVVGQCYTRKGFYQPKDGDTVVDVGGNIGVFALYLQSLAKVNVYTFEPAPQTREVLEKNVVNNNLAEFVRVIPVAIGNFEGTISMRCSSSEFGHSSIFDSEHLRDAVDVTVQSATLPSQMTQLGIDHVDLLKIDIEGAEVQLLEGMTPDAWTKVDRVTMETHDNITPGAHRFSIDRLVENGFCIVSEKEQGGLGFVNATRLGKL